MSRAAVPRDHAERVLGHVVSGVEGVYDQYSYQTEKGEALAKLANLVAKIGEPRRPSTMTARLSAGRPARQAAAAHGAMVGVLPVQTTEQERRQRPAAASSCGMTACHDSLVRPIAPDGSWLPILMLGDP
jgi:hypothetical protein